MSVSVTWNEALVNTHTTYPVVLVLFGSQHGGLNETDSGLWRTDIVLWFLDHVSPEAGQQGRHKKVRSGWSSPRNIMIAVVVVLLVVDEVVPEPVSWILSHFAPFGMKAYFFSSFCSWNLSLRGILTARSANLVRFDLSPSSMSTQ